MIKKLVLISAIGVTLSGCFMAPLALLGPASAGFSTASLTQYGVTQTANYVVKVRTGDSIAEHAVNIISKEYELATKTALQRTLMPEKINIK